MKYILITLAIIIIFLLGSMFYAKADEEMTDGQLTLELNEQAANFHYEWETTVTASVGNNFCNNCIAQAEDRKTREMCYALFCK